MTPEVRVARRAAEYRWLTDASHFVTDSEWEAVKRMIADGRMERDTLDDGRRRIVRLTPAGHAWLAEQA